MPGGPLKPSCKQIIDILPDPFVVIDRNHDIVAANRAYQERYGLDEAGLAGRKCYEVSHHSRVPCSMNGEHCPLEEVLTRKQATEVMHVHYDRRGREEYVQLHASPLFDDSGEIVYVGETIFPVNLPDDDEGDTLLVGRSRPLLRMTSLLQRVAPTQTTVLLLGESGVGKEQVAKYLHHFSRRASSPLAVVDCGALGEQLIETELFGYERGAFTGADKRKKGLFEAADGGTLFIDEVCELPLPLQTKLLRVLESGTVRRVGGTEYIKVDVRVIAATNRDIEAMVAEGAFRQDLYYRLSAFPVRVPTLRERKDDIPALAEFFLSHLPRGDRYLPLSPAVIERLLDHEYPGNVRELRNVLERAAILSGAEAIRPDHLKLNGARVPDAAPAAGRRVNDALIARRDATPGDEAVVAALRRCNGHRGRAAAELGISERTLYRRLRRMRAE